MGMYVCHDCAEKHVLKLTDYGFPGFKICEVCFRDHQWALWTNDLTRFGPTLEKQIKDHKEKIIIPATPITVDTTNREA